MMKRFIIRQLPLILALVMLLSLTGMTEELSANDVDVQAIGLDGLSLDDLFIDGELDLEIDPNAGVDLTLDEITLDEIPGEAVDGGVDVEVEGIEGETLIDGSIDPNGLDPQGPGVSGSQEQYSLPGADSDNAALADAYLRGVLPGFGKDGRTFASPNAGRKALVKKGLTGSVAVYDAVKPMIVAVAEGQRTSTVFELDAAALGTTNHWWSPADLGLASLSDPNIGDCLLTKEGVDSWEIGTALLEDCPYHLYWFDKTKGWSLSYYYSTQGDKARLDSMTLALRVSADYAAGDYKVNALPARINAAVTNINKTVNDNKGLGDLKKVTAYADAICGYVEYNFPAARDDSTPYGDPWQLVFIFDGDPDTKVVCEGYSKGFKYLCDLSSFDGDVGCVLIVGMLSNDNGVELGLHMWNSLKMPDGRCYLVDLTNCDAGDTCNYSRFLKGCTGEAGGPYVCAGLRYEFDDSMVNQFGEDSPWLTYSNVDYGKKDVAAWSAFQKTINNATNNSTVTLTKDLTAGSGNAGLLIPAGKSLTLDLAGHTLNRGLKSENDDGYVICVKGRLTVVDSVGGGIITGGYNSAYGGGIYVAKDASLTLKGGTICGNRALDGGGLMVEDADCIMTGGTITCNTGDHGGGVYVHAREDNDRSTFTLKGGSIDTNIAKAHGAGLYVWGTNGKNAVLTIEKGQIKGNKAYKKDNSAHSGGGVYCTAGTVRLKGGLIADNRARDAAGIEISHGSILEMSGGEIRGNTADYGINQGIGGGINLYDSTLTLSGGSISGNSAGWGGGLYLQDSFFRMSGGTISGNKAYDAGGVRLGGKFEMTGGSITDNAAERSAGGISFDGKVKLSGTPNISGNKCDSKDSNFTFDPDEGCKFTIAGSLGKSAHVGVTDSHAWLHKPGFSYVFTSGVGANGNIGAFFSDDPEYVITRSKNGKEAMLIKARVKLTECKCTVKNQVYTGKAIKAAVTVEYDGKTLKQGRDYTLAYKNNKNVGVATVTVTGKGENVGTKTLTFNILPRKSAVSKVTLKGKTATLTLMRRPEASGYQVQYGLKSSFSGAKSLKVKQAKTVKATLKSLKKGKTYYVRVRAYKTVGKKTYYSAWSGKKSVKVK